MSNRERWTVYPLLFLTLGIALRDKITGSAELRTIRCEELVVTRTIRCEDLAVTLPDGNPRVHLACSGPAASGAIVLYGQNNNPSASLGSDDGKSGALKVYDADGKTQVIVKSFGNAGAIETLSSSGEPQIVLRSNKVGGVVSALRHGKTATTLGAQEEQDAAALAVCASDGKPRVMIHTVNDSGSIETLGPTGQLQVIVNSTDRGGVVSAVDNEHNLIIALGHEVQGSGVFAINLRDNQTFMAPMLPQPLPRNARPRTSGPQPGDKPSQNAPPGEQSKPADPPKLEDKPKSD